MVPVVSLNQKPLMPTSWARARRFLKSRKATGFWKKGIFCIRLNYETPDKTQRVAVGVDPGSKMEGFTVKSETKTFLNIQIQAVDWVKKAVKTRREMRRTRRFRNTPCRKNKTNRTKGGLPPSTKARWDLKLRMLGILKKIFPITDIVVEDISAKTMKGGKEWNTSFSPLEVGKKYFYKEVSKIGNLETLKGYETKDLRDLWGLKKSKDKLSTDFSAHCVDSWALAQSIFGDPEGVDNRHVLFMIPLRSHRRQLYALKPIKGGIRRPYGGTSSLGFKRGSLVVHPKYGLSYVGGTYKNRISLHDLGTGERSCRNAKKEDLTFLAYNSWRTAIHPRPKGRGLLAGEDK